MHPLVSHSTQNTKIYCMTEEKGGARYQEPGFSEEIREMDPTECFADCIRKPAHELLRTPHLQIPQLAYEQFQYTMCHACACTHTMACSQCKFPRVASMKLCRWLVSTCRKPAQLCRIGRKHTNLRIQHHLKAKQTKSCQHPGRLCRIERMHTILWIPPSRGNKNCGPGIGINSEKRSEKASEFLEGLIIGVSPLKTVSKDWKKWWLLQMWTQQCKTSNNMKNQGDLTSQ